MTALDRLAAMRRVIDSPTPPAPAETRPGEPPRLTSMDRRATTPADKPAVRITRNAREIWAAVAGPADGDLMDAWRRAVCVSFWRSDVVVSVWQDPRTRAALVIRRQDQGSTWMLTYVGDPETAACEMAGRIGLLTAKLRGEYRERLARVTARYKRQADEPGATVPAAELDRIRRHAAWLEDRQRAIWQEYAALLRFADDGGRS